MVVQQPLQKFGSFDVGFSDCKNETEVSYTANFKQRLLLTCDNGATVL